MSADQEQTNKPPHQRKSRVSRGGSNKSNTSNRGGGYKRHRNQSGKSKPEEEEEEIPEGEQCIICAEHIKYAALTPCNHTTCHKCTFRQRTLYEKNQCLICRSENDRIIITEQLHREYNDIASNDIVTTDEKHQVDFTSNYAKEDTLLLLSNMCSICNDICPTFKELQDHAKEVHGKYYCLICSKFKKAFKIELSLYTFKQLQKHQSEGNEDEGFTGHPECKHCRNKNNRYYSEDELNIHIRDRHERCFICDQVQPKTADYYRNYDSLYYHFQQEHYVCNVASCVEKRFVVFRDDLDLTAHMLKEHGNLTGTGSGNKIVIGSNSHHFSQLSSNFQRSASPIIRGWNGQDDSAQQTPEVKRMRFEERAKHYLNYDLKKYDEFHELNTSFKNKKITAQELLKFYKQDLFIHQTTEELNFLIKEFSEFFTEGSSLQKDLLSIVKELKITEEREQFPVLGGSKSSNVLSQSWVKSSSSSSASSTQDKFPALRKPTRPVAKPVNPISQPIRYTTVLKSVQPKKSNSPIINTSQASTSYRPTYLENTKKAPSLSSLPVLGSSSIHNTPSTSNSTRNGSTGVADSSKFPALEKKSTKKVIPRVNAISNTPSWGAKAVVSSSTTAKSSTEDDGWGGIPIVDKRKQKAKRNKGGLVSDIL